MNFQERKRKIIAAVYEAGSLSVFELSDELSSSPATIRRDLQEICDEGLLLRTHGGAMKPENPIVTSFVEKASASSGQKERIGKRAAEEVQDGDTIFMDCGSTVFQMCRFLKQKKHLRVITNSLPILAELINIPSIQINLIGGELNQSRKALHGDKAVQHIDSYHATKAFIGVDGLTPENGLTAHSEHESTITSAFIRNAGKVILLCDTSKIGKDSYIKFAALTAINCLVTDNALEYKRVAALTAKGLEKIIFA